MICRYEWTESGSTRIEAAPRVTRGERHVYTCNYSADPRRSAQRRGWPITPKRSPLGFILNVRVYSFNLTL